MSNGEILSEAEVEFLLNAAGADEAPAPNKPDFDERSVTMRGDLEQIELADIFQTLAMSKMAGVLRLRNPLDERHVLAEDGHVRLLVGNRVASRRLGQRLIQAGLVQPDQLRDALAQQREERRPLGQILVDAGVVSTAAIDEIVGNQVAEDLFGLFTWQYGTFEFYKGPVPEGAARDAFADCPAFEIQSLLLEVARRADEWRTIFAAVGSLDDVPHRLGPDADEATLGEPHRALLAGVDSIARYREIAEQSTFGLFEMARAARDLVVAGVLANLDEGSMLVLATHQIQAGDKKRALILLQTLRERPGDRPIGVLQGMAKVLEAAGERGLAGSLLLEAAQRQSDSAGALELARAAHRLSPHDAGTLSFLRTVLVAHAPADSHELEQCTIALLDALIEADLAPTAMEIIEDARRTGSVQPAILMREVRVRQKSRDTAGACAVLEELVALHDQRGERRAANEALEGLLRIDRSRKDVRRLLAQRRRTAVGKVVRVAAMLAAAAMVAGTGLVGWQQYQLTTGARAADVEIGSLLQAGDREAARARLEHWATVLGDCESIDDLRNRVAFAEATEAGRRQKSMRIRVNGELTAAAELLGKGELAAALAAYSTIAAEPMFTREVADVLGARLEALAADISRTSKGLAARMPPPPGERVDRRELVRQLTELQTACPPILLTAFQQLAPIVAAGRLPAFLDAELPPRITRIVNEAEPAFTRAHQATAEYEQALARNDQQRQLDPVFKAAVDCENGHDFAGALTRYRELEQAAAVSDEMRSHFRDRVARNATIVRLTEALQAATVAGDFATACQQLRALRLSFPDVPFDRLVRLPLRVDSLPRGVRVSSAGQDLGQTPLLLSRLPAETSTLSLRADGFRDETLEVGGDDVGEVMAQLLLAPSSGFEHGSMIEVPPLVLGDAAVFVDRSGNVTARPAAGGGWTFRSGDLSGLLTAPIVHSTGLLVGSLDGDLRCLDAATGKVAWSLPGLPTEIEPLLVGDLLVVATTNRELAVVDVPQRHRGKTLSLQSPASRLFAHGRSVLALGEDGHVAAFALPELMPRWLRQLPDMRAPVATFVAGCVVVADDRGHLVAVDAGSGEVRWSKQLDRELLGAPAVCGADLLIATREH
ncbi:MAG: DUF4388 domain-containing protein, partial [Planctomycetota bacterium]